MRLMSIESTDPQLKLPNIYLFLAGQNHIDQKYSEILKLFVQVGKVISSNSIYIWYSYFSWNEWMARTGRLITRYESSEKLNAATFIYKMHSGLKVGQ